MAVKYIRDSEWRQYREPAFGGGGYDLDTCRVPWRGGVKKKAAFIAKLKKFNPLSGDHPKMFWVDTDDDQDPHYPTITFSYVGIRGGAGGPPVKAVDSLVQKILNVNSSGFDGGLAPVPALTFTGQYLTPRTSYTWYTTQKPNAVTPQFSTPRGAVNPADTLFNCVTNDGAPVSPAVARKYVALLKLKNSVSDYVITDIVPGGLWSCSCVVDKDFTI